jgi:hypothetical protein
MDDFTEFIADRSISGGEADTKALWRLSSRRLQGKFACGASAPRVGRGRRSVCVRYVPANEPTDVHSGLGVRDRVEAAPWGATRRDDMSSLPKRCACAKHADLSANAFHLLSCSTLCSASKGNQSLRAEWAANIWNERHAKIKRALAQMLGAAGIAAIDEPGPLNDGEQKGDEQSEDGPMPDQLMAFVSHGAGPIVRRVCTDVAVIECNTTAYTARLKDSRMVSSLRAKVHEKRTKHVAAARRAGTEFVPLVASSLGSLHEDFVRFLQLDDVRLDDERLFILYGGRRAFKARLMDSVSCAIARHRLRGLRGSREASLRDDRTTQPATAAWSK